MEKTLYKERTLYEIESSALIYPATSRPEWSHEFRISAYLKEDVKVEYLEQAVIDVSKRLPSFYTCIYETDFCKYLTPLDDIENVEIVAEDTELFKPFDLKDTTKSLFRVLYKENKISVEYFHVLTDGNGGTLYLKTLLGRYYELQGYEITKIDGVLDVLDMPKDDETDDAFKKVAGKKFKNWRKSYRGYQYRQNDKEVSLSYISKTFSIAEIKKISKQYNCTITEFLLAVYAMAFYEARKNDVDNKTSKYPVRVSVPVNMRPKYNSESVKNFVLYGVIKIDENENIKQMISQIHEELKRELSDEVLQNMLNQNVMDQEMFIAKIVPTNIEEFVIRSVMKNTGEISFSTTLSNLGLQKLPSELMEHVDSFEFLISKTNLNRVNCSVIGIGDKLSISLSSIVENKEIENFFFSYLDKSLETKVK